MSAFLQTADVTEELPVSFPNLKIKLKTYSLLCYLKINQRKKQKPGKGIRQKKVIEKGRKG